MDSINQTYPHPSTTARLLKNIFRYEENDKYIDKEYGSC